MRTVLTLCVAVSVLCFIGIGCQFGSSGGPESEAAGRADQSAKAEPNVSIPYDDYCRLLRQEQAKTCPVSPVIPARIEFEVERRLGFVQVNARCHLTSTAALSTRILPFSVPGSQVTAFSTDDRDGVSILATEAGPLVTIARAGTVSFSVECRLRPRRGHVAIHCAPFPVATVAIAEGQGYVLRGGEGSRLVDGRRTWFIPRAETSLKRQVIDILMVGNDEGFDLTKPTVTSVTTLVTAKKNGLGFRSMLHGVGRRPHGGSLLVELPIGTSAVAISRAGALASFVEERGRPPQCRVALSDDCPSPWTVSVTGAIGLTTATTTVAFSPPRQAVTDMTVPQAATVRPWDGGYLALGEVGPRHFGLAKSIVAMQGTVWEHVERERLQAAADVLGYEGLPRRLLAYRARAFELPLFVGASPAGVFGTRAAVVAVEAASEHRTELVERYAVSEQCDVFDTTVNYRLTNGDGPFRFRLPRGAVLNSVSFDQRRLDLTANDAGVYAIDGTFERDSLISVRFEQRTTPTAGAFGRFDLSLPEMSLHSLGTTWKVELPRNHMATEADTDLVCPLEKPPFFLRRLGHGFISLAGEGFELLASVLAALKTRLVGVSPSPSAQQRTDPAVGETAAAKAHPAPEGIKPVRAAPAETESLRAATADTAAAPHGTVPGIAEPVQSKLSFMAGFLPPSLASHGGTTASHGGTAPAELRATSLVLYSVSRHMVAPLWIAAFLIGILCFAYLWLVSHGEGPVELKYGIPGAVIIVGLFDYAFPFAAGGVASSFFLLTGGLGVFRLTAYVERSLRLAQARQIALREAGTIGDLEGQSVFFATRDKRNIIALSELFEDAGSVDDEGIQFLVPDDTSSEKGGEQ